MMASDRSPAGRRVRTQTQIDRDRARSRAWHARQRAIVAQSQGLATGRPAGRRPDARPDAELGYVDLVELVATLRETVERLHGRISELENAEFGYSRVEADRERSRRNRRRWRTANATATGTRPAPGRTRPAPPPSRGVVNTPPGDDHGVANITDVAAAMTTKTAPIGDAVWSDAAVVKAASARPGLDLAVLKLKAADWLARHPECPRLTVSVALSFVERWRPGLDTAASSYSSAASSAATWSPSSATSPVPGAKQWIVDRQAEIEAYQAREWGDAAALEPVGAG